MFLRQRNCSNKKTTYMKNFCNTKLLYFSKGGKYHARCISFRAEKVFCVYFYKDELLFGPQSNKIMRQSQFESMKCKYRTYTRHTKVRMSV